MRLNSFNYVIKYCEKKNPDLIQIWIHDVMVAGTLLKEQLKRELNFEFI